MFTCKTKLPATPLNTLLVSLYLTKNPLHRVMLMKALQQLRATLGSTGAKYPIDTSEARQIRHTDKGVYVYYLPRMSRRDEWSRGSMVEITSTSRTPHQSFIDDNYERVVVKKPIVRVIYNDAGHGYTQELVVSWMKLKKYLIPLRTETIRISGLKEINRLLVRIGKPPVSTYLGGYNVTLGRFTDYEGENMVLDWKTDTVMYYY